MPILDGLIGLTVLLFVLFLPIWGLMEMCQGEPETSEQWFKRTQEEMIKLHKAAQPPSPDFPAWEPNPPKYRSIVKDQQSR